MDYIPESLTLTVTVPTYDHMQVFSDDATGTMDWDNPHDNRKYYLYEPQLTRYGWGYEGWGLGEWGAGWTIDISVNAFVSSPGLYKFAVVCFDTAGNQGDNGSVTETYQTPRPKKPGAWGTGAANYSDDILTIDL